VKNISSKTYFIINLNLSIFLLLLLWCSLFTFSSFQIDAFLALKAIFVSESEKSMLDHIVVDIRLPRALIAALCGAALAGAGAVMQAITNNPLASPGILGINAGAALGMAIIITSAHGFGNLGMSMAALMGGSLTWIMVMFIGKSWQGGNENTRLVLAGIAVSALCAALTKALVILEEEQASAIMVWLAGTFADSSWQDLFYLFPFILIGVLATIIISPKLNLLLLGNEYARSLGINPQKYQLIGSIIVLIIVSGVISTIGSLGFVSLLIPHMARMLIGTDHKRFVPTAMLLGACFVLLADVVSRAIIFPLETPAGAILALIGAPFFIYLVRKKL